MQEDVRICILRVGGTNCDAETKRAFDDAGAKAEIVHLNEAVEKGNLSDYNAIVIPGGFSYGDHVRAGAIWAKEVMAKLGSELLKLAEEGRPVLGICNGFQVLVEAGLLPGFKGVSKYPEAALATNVPIGYYCGWVHVRHVNSGRCIFTQKIPKGKMLRMPVAHAEGRFIFSKENEEALLEQLRDNDQLVFVFCSENGGPAGGKYPANPNGSFYDIAGLCNAEGTIFGLMPHPERAYYRWQQPDWTQTDAASPYGDGRLVFESMVEYLKAK
ncbi:MAG: phosphoribosylformylglycinamidine synthase I [Candidatus Bathyarchaeota archaeon]|nr:MAG: phosphoribosylformylglycinamidine synthase I [Candidatus Bathyarchaeota archaeon]